MAVPFQNEIVDGYRFKGGDPADQNSWEKFAGLKPGDIQDGYTFRGGDPSKQDAWERGTSINRTWTEAITDTARDATAGTLEAASGLTGLFRRAGSATQTGQANLSDIETGQSAVDTSSQISQPGKIEKALSGTAEVIRDEQSDKRKWQRQALQDTDGAWEAAKFLVTNPSAIGGLMAESAPGSLLAGGVGGFVGKGVLAATGNKAVAMSAAGIGAMAGEGILSAGSLASDIEKLLDKQGIMDPEVRSKAINIAYASGLATGYLGKIGKGIEVMPFMRDSIKEALAKAVPKAMLKEGAEEFAQGFQEAVAKNLALGQAGAKDEDGKAITNLTQGAAKDATIGALAGVGTGGVMPLASRGLDRLQPTPPAAGTPAPPAPPSPSTIPLSGDLEADLDAINNAPITPIADAFKSAEMRDTRDLQDQAIALDGGDNASELVSGNTPASQGTPAIQTAGNSVPQTPDAVQNAAENLPAVDAAARTDVANVAPDMAQKAGNDAISAGRGAAGDILTAANSGVSSADGQQTNVATRPDNAPGVPGSAAAIEPAVAPAPGVDSAPAPGPAAQNERANAAPTGQVNGQPTRQPAGDSGVIRPDEPSARSGDNAGNTGVRSPAEARGMGADGKGVERAASNVGTKGQISGQANQRNDSRTRGPERTGNAQGAGATASTVDDRGILPATDRPPQPASQRQSLPARGANQPERRAAARNYDADVAEALNKARELGRALKPDSPQSDVDAAYRAAMAAEDLREAREQERKAPKFVDYAERKGKAKGEIKFFSNASAALKYKGNKKIRGYVPRETSDGWVLSKPFKPRSEKQLANDAKKKAKTEPIDILRDELQVALRKMGGIDIDEALASGFDKADIARANIPGFGNRKLFRKGGMSLDAAREAIAQGSEQAGYLDPNQADDLNHFIDRLMDSVKDQASYYSFAGQEYQMAMSEAAKEADRGRSGVQLDREDQAEAGIDSLPKQEQNEVQAAWASIDRSMLERIYPSDVIEELSAAEAQRRKEQEDEITAFAERETISENGEGSPADRTRSAQDDRGDEPRSAGRGDEGNTDEAGQGTRSEVTNSVYTSEERVKETAESAQVETPVNTPVEIASSPESNTPANPLIAAPVPKAGLTIKDIPKSALKRIYVDMPVMEDDGTVTMEKRAAKDALASLSRQEKAYRALRACVG